MREHRYRITLEHLATASEGQVLHEPLRFEAGNHDDIFSIVSRLRGRGQFDDDTSAQLALGIKLFGEVMLKNRKHPLFAEIQPAFREFIMKLKSQGKAAAGADAAPAPATE
ncbi:DUF3861 domain-containing protein [Herbaspirillum rubrisubalbicans]|uniref:DUF3861 domain-containing protein n=1 Tax=Herbaspirillum rubrisubalbicans TaxID=80842 RepID=A0AAD0XGY4_9BURK|nr:DUF3861 domain-containing protein [Herbaspirillum rubrisubalbicans]AYR25821.1 DUF3861 domain-containing protein [Herbaspirillum rubrisubalbicans]